MQWATERGCRAVRVAGVQAKICRGSRCAWNVRAKSNTITCKATAFATARFFFAGGSTSRPLTVATLSSRSRLHSSWRRYLVQVDPVEVQTLQKKMVYVLRGCSPSEGSTRRGNVMNHHLTGMKVAALVEHGFEESELLEPRKALEDAGARVDVISPVEVSVKGWHHGTWGKEVKVDQPLADAHPEDYDALLLPGGVFNPD